MFETVRTRLTIWHVSVLGVLLIILGAAVYAMLSHELARGLDTALAKSLESVTSALADELAEGPDLTRVPAGALADLTDSDSVFSLYDLNGSLLAEKPLGTTALNTLPQDWRALADNTLYYTKKNAPSGGGGDRRLALRHVAFSKYHASYLIVVSQSLVPLFGQLSTIRKIFLVIAPLVLFLAGSGGWFLTKKSLSPVVAMSEKARRIGADNMGERLVAVNPRDELGRLAGAFNELLDRLDVAFSHQREFMTEAAHELRTPISVIQTATAVALDQEHRREEEYRDLLGTIDEQVRHLGRTVEDMFCLARADAGYHSLQLTNFYLDELLDDTGRVAKVLARKKGISMELKEMVESPFVGDEELLRQMIFNILNNAINYTPAGGTVGMNLDRQNTDYVITVTDTGIGIPSEAHPRVFERFFRASNVTSNSPLQVSGAGLGLSIARWIAEEHHGRLELASSDASGSTFVATLPTPS